MPLWPSDREGLQLVHSMHSKLLVILFFVRQAVITLRNCLILLPRITQYDNPSASQIKG